MRSEEQVRALALEEAAQIVDELQHAAYSKARTQGGDDLEEAANAIRALLAQAQPSLVCPTCHGEGEGCHDEFHEDGQGWEPFDPDGSWSKQQWQHVATYWNEQCLEAWKQRD